MTTTRSTSDVLAATSGPLREQLLAAAERFATDAQPLGELLAAMVADVARAEAEPLEIFPVCHHSPASALHFVRRVQRKPPRVIFMEMCEDFRPLCEKFRDCKLPVAFQAFAGQSDAFPKDWTPLSVVAPFTEFSAEYQAIVWCLENEETELAFVDRSVDHIFQWMPQKEDELEKHLGHDEPGEDDVPPSEEGEGASIHHGAALGVQIGKIEPTLEQFREFLLKNAQVRHFSEWWDQYVEQAVLGADYGTYRQVFFLVGSLLRRLGQKEDDREEDRQRERYMWTRMKDYLREHKIRPEDALYICGAIHAASDVEEYGTHTPKRWEIPPATGTSWLYGTIPSSYAAIERQFTFPHGTVTLSDATWQKGLKALGVRPFALAEKKGSAKGAKAAKRAPKANPAPAAAVSWGNGNGDGDGSLSLVDFLTRPPVLAGADEEQLLAWCVGIVNLARKNGYLSSTADSIAVYHTATMLAQLRNRRHPSAYDFRDAAVTCLEKDRTPGKRDVARLCEVLLGGDRIGQVGYTSLPPLARDVYDRLAPLGLNLKSTTIQRALLDLRKNPELLPCSDLLWKLLYLLRDRTFRPIMGERGLGHVPTQESWDIDLGKNQTGVIMLGYEGVTVEHVLEKRLKAMAYAADATPVTALQAVEDCIVYLKSARLAEEIGEHSVGLLTRETGAQSAPQIFERVRRLVHYHRSTPGGLPEWLKQFVTTGYSHYCTLLPAALADKGTTPEQVAGMLAFLFTLESLALSLGCSRDQLVIAVRQASPLTDDPNKLGLLWSAEWLLGLRTVEAIRAFFDELLDNPMALPSYPAYINGFLLALKFTPLVARLVVELLSRAFERLPERVLLPWVPGLLMMLRPHADSLMPSLLKEASLCFPADLRELRQWQPPWERPAAVPSATPTSPTPAPAAGAPRTPAEDAAAGLLRAYPTSTDALAVLLGAEGSWQEAAPPAPGERAATGDRSPAEDAARDLLHRHTAAAEALARLLR